MGLTSTMVALVLALLIASAKTSHDMQSNEVTQMAADFVLLDRIMTRYGPETREARALIPAAVASVLSQTWMGESYRSENLERAIQASAEGFDEKIRQLEPHTDFQRALYAQAAQVSLELSRNRSLLQEQTGGSIPMPFLIVLVFWLALIFTSFGLYAPLNPTVLGALLACAISASSAVFLVVELDRPFQGPIKISSLPLRNALTHLRPLDN